MKTRRKLGQYLMYIFLYIAFSKFVTEKFIQNCIIRTKLYQQESSGLTACWSVSSGRDSASSHWSGGGGASGASCGSSMVMQVSGGVAGESGNGDVTTRRGEGGGDGCVGGAGGALLARSSCSTLRCNVSILFLLTSSSSVLK